MSVGRVSVRIEGGVFDPSGGALLARTLGTAMRVATARVVATAAKKAPANLGHLRASLGSRVDVQVDPKRRTPVRVIGHVGSPLEYAKWMEVGTEHGKKWPPRAPIEAWVRRTIGPDLRGQVRAVRSFDRRTRKKGQRRRSQKADVERAVKQVTYLVQRKIGRSGLKERRYLRAALKQETEWVRRVFAAAMRKFSREVS